MFTASRAASASCEASLKNTALPTGDGAPASGPAAHGELYGHLAPDFLHQDVSKLQFLKPEHRENLLRSGGKRCGLCCARAARAPGRRKAAGADRDFLSDSGGF